MLLVPRAQRTGVHRSDQEDSRQCRTGKCAGKCVRVLLNPPLSALELLTVTVSWTGLGCGSAVKILMKSSDMPSPSSTVAAGLEEPVRVTSACNWGTDEEGGERREGGREGGK